MTKQPEPEGFADFWAIWRPHARKTDGRADARKVFAAHVKAGNSPQDMIDGARYFIRNMTDRDRDYIPLAATWLNRGAYEDFGPAERAYQERMASAQATASAMAAQPKPAHTPPKSKWLQQWEAKRQADEVAH